MMTEFVFWVNSNRLFSIPKGFYFDMISSDVCLINETVIGLDEQDMCRWQKNVLARKKAINITDVLDFKMFMVLFSSS